MIPGFLQTPLAAILLAVLCTPAAARDIKARLVYFSPAAGDPAELFIRGAAEGEMIRCEPTTSVAKEPVTLPVDSSGKVAFLKSESGGATVATASVPGGVGDAVFFFLRSPGAAAGEPAYQVLVVDESRRNLPKGGSFVCNVAPQKARMVIGEFRYELPPGKPVYVKRPKTDGYNMAPFQVQMEQGTSWTPVKDSTLRFAETERYFIITYLEMGNRPSVKIYKQPVPAAAPSAAKS